MELERYIGLYLSETREHLRALNRAILAFESSGSADAAGALDEAFRAAHTIKGMAATMGYRGVAELAHALEDRLDEVRRGGGSASGELVDRLLAEADALETAVEEAVAAAVPAEGELAEIGVEPAAASKGARRGGGARGGGAPPGTEWIVRVVIEPGCALKAARAHIVVRNAAAVAPVLGTAPAEIDDDFDGVLLVYVGEGADRSALEAGIRSAGDIESVEFEVPIAASTRSGGAAAGDGRGIARHVRVDERQLAELADGIGELAVLFGELQRIAAAAPRSELAEITDRIGRNVAELQHAALAVRMEPVAEVFDRFPRVVRDAARSVGKEVEFVLEGREIELDRQMLEDLSDPLVHLLRNAVDHGLESAAERVAAGKPARGQVRLRARRERSHVVIEVEDDGRGVARDRVIERALALGIPVRGGADALSDEEFLRLLSHPGLSTRDEVSDLSGRGVGLDAVVTRVRALGGAVALRSVPGEGTTVSLRMPTTLALAQALRVKVGDEDYAVPLTHIAEAVELAADRIERVDAGEVLRLRGEDLPLVRLRTVLSTPGDGQESAALVTELGGRRGALAVDALVGREQIVIKGFDRAVGMLPIFSGVTLLPDGRPALVLDPVSVF
ncbi:MAG TPA: chemotaxis protein CheA [Longimicrobiales bacterium]